MEKVFVKSDKICGFYGTLELVVTEAATGKVVETKTWDNLVVTNLNNQAVYLVGGELLAIGYIDRVALGVGSVAATVADESITNPPGGEESKAVTATFGSSPVSVTFTATFGADDANGVAYTEAGLLFAGVSPSLAARRVFGTMTKSNLFVWTFNWTLRWV